MNKIKIAIADDYPVFREGIVLTLEMEGNIEIIAEADNGKELIEKIEANLPDVIIMDFKMPVMDGMQATRIIKEKYPAIKIIFMSMYEDEKFINSFTQCGADGYLLKNAEPEEIKEMIYKLVKI